MKVVLAICIACFAATSIAAEIPGASTPGVVNTAVTQANIKKTICVSGWTKTIRPPATYTTALKKQQMKAMKLTGTAKDYEEDHRVPLEVGGHPRDPKNLWPQPWVSQYGARDKDQLENSVHRAVCGGAMTLKQGQAIFLAPDWRRQFDQFFKKGT